jgi:hypothetical protein
MLPNPHGDPTSLGKPTVGVCVTSAVSGHLVRPIGRIRHCNGVMLGTSVPEAAVQEYRYPFGGKDQVRRPPQALDGGRRNPIPKAEGVDRGAQGDLGFRVPASV